MGLMFSVSWSVFGLGLPHLAFWHRRSLCSSFMMSSNVCGMLLSSVVEVVGDVGDVGFYGFDVFSYGWYIITHTGFPHSDISGSLPLPVHRSFSQATTSFIASDCQGIHRMRFFT